MGYQKSVQEGDPDYTSEPTSIMRLTRSCFSCSNLARRSMSWEDNFFLASLTSCLSVLVLACKEIEEEKERYTVRFMCINRWWAACILHYATKILNRPATREKKGRPIPSIKGPKVHFLATYYKEIINNGANNYNRSSFLLQVFKIKEKNN